MLAYQTLKCSPVHMFVAYNDVFQSTYTIYMALVYFTVCIMCLHANHHYYVPLCFDYRFLVFNQFSWECVCKLPREWST